MFGFLKRKQRESRGTLPMIANENLRDAIYKKPLKIKIEHAKSVVNGKLYDTEISKCMGGFDRGRILFRTKKGNYFSCLQLFSTYETPESRITEAFYCDIRPESDFDAMTAIGRCNVEKYIELFGEPEQA